MDIKIIKKLEAMNACKPAMDWLSKQKSVKQAWEDCKDGSWMLWLLGELSGEVGSDARKKLVLAACQCARLSLKFVPEDEHRPEQAICAAEQYALGDSSISLDNLFDFSDAADAADAAAYAAADAAAAAADKKQTLKECANIVRKFYPEPPRF